MLIESSSTASSMRARGHGPARRDRAPNIAPSDAVSGCAAATRTTLVGQRGVDARRQHRRAAALRDAHHGAVDDAELGRERARHADHRRRASAVSCSDAARRTIASASRSARRRCARARRPRGAGAAAARRRRCRPAASCAGDRRASPSASARTSSERLERRSPPGPSRLPSTRSTFQAGRASPSGLTTPWKLCTRPSALTKVPEVSVNGAIGSSTSANRRRARLNGAQRDDHLGLAERGDRAAPDRPHRTRLDVQQHAGLQRRSRRASGRRSGRPRPAARRPAARRRVLAASAR